MIYSEALIKKLIRIALYTSALIAGVSIIPFLQAYHTDASGKFFFVVSLIILSNILMIWFLNIILFYLFERYGNEGRKINLMRYILSFVIIVPISGGYLVFIESLQLADVFMINDDLNRLRETSRVVTFISSFFTNTFVLFMQELVILREKKARVELENAQLKIENTEALNLQLKQHIHPHFLFNSLSILKSLIHKNPEMAEEYLIRLSDFLRISISSNKSNLVKLRDELKLCEDFIEMQKIRFGDALQVNINISDETNSGTMVPGFSIQMLLENAIKHNALTTTSPLKITIDEENAWIVVTNNIQKKHSIEHTTRSGLANLAQRYKILSDHSINIEKSDTYFKVMIKMLDNGETKANR